MLVRKPLPSAGRTGVADAKWQSVCSLDVLIQSSINPLHSLTVYTLGPPLNPVRDRGAHDRKFSVVTSSELQQCQLPVVSARDPSAASSAR